MLTAITTHKWRYQLSQSPIYLLERRQIFWQRGTEISPCVGHIRLS